MNKPIVRLLEMERGSVFCLIGKVYKTLNKSNLKNQAKEFVQEVGEEKSYDVVLQICAQYVDVY